MQYEGLMGGLFKTTEKIWNLLSLNLLWFILNLPILFLILNLLLSEDLNQLAMSGITIVAIAPIVFFPATTAMFGVIRKWILKQEVSLIRVFFQLYKENYKRSFVGGLLLSIVWLLLIVDYVYFSKINHLVGYLFLVFLFILLVVTLHFISLTVHVQSSLFNAFKSVIFLVLGSPFITVSIGLISGLILYISLQLLFIIPFFLGSIIAYVSFYGFLKAFSTAQRFKEQEDLIS